jgi:ABC-type uncharacterized transport system substrate-binding protein
VVTHSDVLLDSSVIRSGLSHADADRSRDLVELLERMLPRANIVWVAGTTLLEVLGGSEQSALALVTELKRLSAHFGDAIGVFPELARATADSGVPPSSTAFACLMPESPAHASQPSTSRLMADDTTRVESKSVRPALTDIPIVFAVVVDPVADNVVPSLERPGGILTGVTSFDPKQATKQIQLLMEVIPGLKRVAILGDQGVSEVLIKASEEQARALGLHPQRLRVTGPSPDLDAAFAAFKKERAEALVVLEEPVLGVQATRIAEMAAKDRLPTLFAPSRAAAGGLLAYGTSQVEAIRHMAAYVDKVLKGAKPSELPVEKVTRYELIVNQKTAREIGVAIPPAVLKRADQVIQ